MKYDTRIQFERLDDIGSGEGSSTTFLARDLQLDAIIVIKGVDKELLNPVEYFTEARIIASVPHPNVVEVNYASQDDDCVYLAMPYFKAGSLQSLLNERYLAVRQIIKFALEFMGGLHYIHTKKLLHFDVKPSNVLINDSGVAVLTDFGLARYTDEYGLATPKNTYWTHTAPEALARLELDVLTEVYQCGLTLYQMCNGIEEFADQWASHKDGDSAIEKGIFPNRKSYLPHIPTQLRNIVNRALSVNPVDRYQSVLELMNAISRVDKNLDWNYTPQHDGTYVWFDESKSTPHQITVYSENGIWGIVGQKIGTRTTTIRDWTVSGLRTQDEAFKKVRGFIADSN